MALREFRDAHGVEWRVWATLPETSALVRVRSGPLGEMEKGWLTFECAEGRKRLTPFPPDWDTLSDRELERWCSEAKAPPPRRPLRPGTSAGERATGIPATDPNVLDPTAPTRTFTEAGGRRWRVAEHERTERVPSPNGGPERVVTHFVLRFSSDSDVLELRTYPMAWARLADVQLLRLAGQAERMSPG